MTDHVLAAVCGLIGGALVAGAAFVYWLGVPRRARRLVPPSGIEPLTGHLTTLNYGDQSQPGRNRVPPKRAR